MAKLPKFTLIHNEKKRNWQLENNKTDKIIGLLRPKQTQQPVGFLRRLLEKKVDR